MATRKLEVEVVGNVANLERNFRKARTETGLFGKEIEKSGRGAVAATGMFHSLGRSVAFASGAFLGGAGLISVVKTSIDVAETARKSQEQLAVTMRNAGLSYDDNKQKIESFIGTQSKLAAFQQNDLRQSFDKLVLATKNVTGAMHETALAEDIARGRHIDLSSATQIVVKAQEGMVGQLRRLGIDVPKHATGVQALTLLYEKYHGQSVAGATASDHFHVALTNLERVVGTQLLPTFTQGVTKLAAWLQKLVDSGKAAHYAHEAVKTLKTIVHDAGAVIGAVDKVTGSFKHTLELLAGVLVGAKLVNGLSGTVGAIRSLGALAGAKGAAGDVGLLTSRLNALKAIGPIAIPITLAVAIVTGLTGDQGPGPPGDRQLGKEHPKNPFLHALETTQGAKLTGSLLKEYKAFREGKITAAQADKWMGAHIGLLQQAGVPLSASTLTGPGSGFSGGKGGVQWSGDYAGLDGGFSTKLANCVASAGGTSINVTSGRRSRAHNTAVGGAANSNHLTGHAADGTCTINGHAYPLGAAPMNYGKFGLRPGSSFDWGGAPDVYHVDDGSNVGGTPNTTTSSGTPSWQGANTKGSGSHHKPKAPVWHGLTEAGLTTIQGSIAATLAHLPSTLDPVEKNAVAHIKAIQESLHLHMTPAELAKDKVALKKWSKNLKDEIDKNKKAAAAAAAEATKQLDRALQLDATKILRQFDRVTQQGLLARAAQVIPGVAQTPQEKALADFMSSRNAADLVKSRADAIANATTPDEVAALTLGFTLDDQQSALEKAAADSRTAQDKMTADLQKAEDERAAQAQQDFQELRDDERTALQNSLEDWIANIEAKKAASSDFFAWLRQHGYDTTGLTTTNSDAPLGPVPHIPTGTRMIGFAKGGIVTGPTLAMVGESGAEAVIPLDRLGGMDGVGGGGVHVHFHGGTFIGGKPEKVAEELTPHLRRSLYRLQKQNRGVSLS